MRLFYVRRSDRGHAVWAPQRTRDFLLDSRESAGEGVRGDGRFAGPQGVQDSGHRPPLDFSTGLGGLENERDVSIPPMRSTKVDWAAGEAPRLPTQDNASIRNSAVSPFPCERSVDDMATLYVLPNTAVDPRKAGCVAYYVPGRLLFLLPDSRDAAQATALPISGPSSLGNSQCQIDVRMSSALINQGGIVLSLFIHFNPGLRQKPFGIWTASRTLATPQNPARTSPWTMVGGRLPSTVF